VQQSKVAAGSRQTAGISFTLQDLKGGDVANVKVKLDSTMMLQSELKSTLSMVKSGSVASMMYKVTNLGTSKVAPSVVTDKLRGYLNSGHSGTKTVLSVLGTVKLGPKGCCSLTQKVNPIFDKKIRNGVNAGANASTNAGTNAGTNASTNTGTNAGTNASTNTGSTHDSQAIDSQAIDNSQAIDSQAIDSQAIDTEFGCGRSQD